MSLDRIIELASAKPVTPSAKALASELMQIELSKFRFRYGGRSIVAAVAVFFIGHFKPATMYFADSFTDRSWVLTWILIAVGLALCGKEVVQGFASAFKSLKG